MGVWIIWWEKEQGKHYSQKQNFLLSLYSFIQEIPVEQIIYSRHYSRLSGRAVNKTRTFPAFVELRFQGRKRKQNKINKWEINVNKWGKI